MSTVYCLLSDVADVLRRIFQDLGYGEISNDDLDVLVETADADRDGRISLEDFRQMLARPPTDSGAASSIS